MASVQCDRVILSGVPLPQAAAQIVLCTCPSAEVAKVLGQGLVEAGHAACVNIVPAMHSIYRWRGAIESADEALLAIKGTIAAYPAIEAYLVRHHPYELPEVIAVPLVAGLPAYLAWLNDPE